MSRIKVLAVASVVLALSVLLIIARHRNAEFRSKTNPATTPAPNFTLTQLDGTPLRLSDYRGKVVLLDFWATWCAPCREEIPRFVEWQQRYGNQGLQVIGISMDDGADPVRKFSREFGMNYPVAMTTQELASRYGGILGLPVNIVIGPDGKIVSKHLGMSDLAGLEAELLAQMRGRKSQ